MMLLDSCIFIDFLRGYPPAVSLFKTLKGREDVCFSTLTETELLSGASNKNPAVREKMLHFIHCFEDVAVDHLIAVRAGDLRRQFGMTIPDAILAATALQWRAELLTCNTSDFKKVPQLVFRSPY